MKSQFYNDNVKTAFERVQSFSILDYIDYMYKFLYLSIYLFNRYSIDNSSMINNSYN